MKCLPTNTYVSTYPTHGHWVQKLVLINFVFLNIMEDSGIDSDANKTATQLQNTSSASNTPWCSLKASASNSCSSNEDLTKNVPSLTDGQDYGILPMREDSQNKKANYGHNLIPIQRLSIPLKCEVKKENVPLVEWDSEESEEEVHFFPVNQTRMKCELTDTFSVEEMEISADEADLELLPPKRGNSNSFSCPSCPYFFRCTIL